MSREEWALQRTGEENEPAVADADRAEHREVVFGQTCPIETAVDVPVDRIKDYGKWHHSGGDQWERVHSANSPDRMVGANDCMWEAAANGALYPLAQALMINITGNRSTFWSADPCGFSASFKRPRVVSALTPSGQPTPTTDAAVTPPKLIYCP